MGAPETYRGHQGEACPAGSANARSRGGGSAIKTGKNSAPSLIGLPHMGGDGSRFGREEGSTCHAFGRLRLERAGQSKITEPSTKPPAVS